MRDCTSSLWKLLPGQSLQLSSSLTWFCSLHLWEDTPRRSSCPSQAFLIPVPRHTSRLSWLSSLPSSSFPIFCHWCSMLQACFHSRNSGAGCGRLWFICAWHSTPSFYSWVTAGWELCWRGAAPQGVGHLELQLMKNLRVSNAEDLGGTGHCFFKFLCHI